MGLHEKPFMAALATLGVTNKRAQEIIRKATVRRAPEVHDLMLKCHNRASHGNLLGTLTGVPLDWQGQIHFKFVLGTQHLYSNFIVRVRCRHDMMLRSAREGGQEECMVLGGGDE